MGEFADYALEETMNAEDDRLAYRLGDMSQFEAYELGIIDELGYEAGPRMSVPKRCRHCGATNLHWGQTTIGWRLFSADNTLHECKQYQKIGK